jgi:hypothetical protein
MAHAHDLAVVGSRRDLELVGQARRLDRERVVARGHERGRQACEYAATVVRDRRELAVHHVLRAHDPAAERLADRLVAEAHAEDRHAAGEPPDQRHRDAGLVRRARARRHDDLLGLPRLDLVERDRVVAMHVHVGPSSPKYWTRFQVKLS